MFRRLSLMVLMVALACSTAHAVPLHYKVTGSMTVESYANPLTISGEMYFDDAVVVDGGPGDPPGFTYNILSFDLSIGDLSFYGSGSIHSIHYDYGASSFTCPFDVMSLNGAGDFTNLWIESYTPEFFYEGGQVYDKGVDYSDFYNLPHRIFAGAMSCNMDVSAHIWSLDITRGSCSPVPEPATIILFGAGVASIAGSGKRKFSKNHNKAR